MQEIQFYSSHFFSHFATFIYMMCTQWKTLRAGIGARNIDLEAATSDLDHNFQVLYQNWEQYMILSLKRFCTMLMVGVSVPSKI